MDMNSPMTCSTDTDSHISCSTDMDSCVTCTAFYKLHAAARLPIDIRVS